MEKIREIIKVAYETVDSLLKELEKFGDNPKEKLFKRLEEMVDTIIESLMVLRAKASKAMNARENSKNKAKEYNEQAIILLKEAKDGKRDQTEADKLAGMIMKQKAQCEEEAQKRQKKYEEEQAKVRAQEAILKEIQKKIEEIKKTKDVKDEDGLWNSTKETINTIERMQDKVLKEEIEAEVWKSMNPDDLINRIDRVLGKIKPRKV